MPVVKLKKAVLYYHKSIQEDVLLTLQKSGVCEIIPRNEDNNETTVTLGSKASAVAKCTECDAVLADLRFMLRFLEPYYKDSVSAIARALGERPSNFLSELAELANSCNTTNKLEITREFERKLSSIRIEMSQLDNTKGIFTKLTGFQHNINIFGSKGRLRAIAGCLPFMQSEAWKENLLKEVGNDCEVYLAHPQKKERYIWGVVMYASERESEVMEICLKSNLTISELDFSKDNVKRNVSEQLELIKTRQGELRSEEEFLHEEIAKFANEHVGVFRKLVDHWSILKERYLAFASGEFTNSTIVTNCWVPVSYLPEIESKLVSLGVFELVTMDPSKDDDVPSLMNNTKWNSPFEVLTTLFSPPQYGSMDPTPKLSPFFFIFFGMCLGDAGYALVIAGLLFFVLRKYKNMPTGTKQFLKLIMIVCVPTFVYGSITGSYFGDLFTIVPFLKPLSIASSAITIFDPMNDIFLVLGISLTFGVIHLFYGQILAFRICWEEGKFVDALFDKIAWLVFLTGLLLIGAVSAEALSRSWMVAAQGIALFGALTIMWHAGREKKGIFSKITYGFLTLYGATSWLGDVLSYSRLLALGLASAAIAMVINMLGMLAAGIPYVGWFFAVVVVVGGHIFNLAINVLGAFVHSLRLQYVEFFGKFYSGGGRVFKPLTCNAKYVNISEK
ncbi:MAG: V-type ATP synthase subunit I [Synergistaceae bacterium]|nr:V-type ATP synthase subunit I [Synergistaceae bacterium]